MLLEPPTDDHCWHLQPQSANKENDSNETTNPSRRQVTADGQLAVVAQKPSSKEKTSKINENAQPTIDISKQ